MTWNNMKPAVPGVAVPSGGGYQSLCPTCRQPIGPETKDQEKSRAIFANHWKKVHLAEGLPQPPTFK